MNSMSTNRRYSILIFIVLALLIWSWFDHFSTGNDWYNLETILEVIRNAGKWGPVFIIVLITTAIVFSPLPSAPIAMASGALFGHTLGTLYIFLGSLLGASIAFSIGRTLGFDAAHSWLENRYPHWKLSDQRRLMVIVMFSRLLPFISFDIVSYAAGITKLTYWRFLLATSIGILPASFLLAHFGEVALEHTFTINGILIIVLICAVVIRQLRTSRNNQQ